VALAVLGLVAEEVPAASKPPLDLPFQHQLLTQLPLVVGARPSLHPRRVLKVLMVLILYLLQSLQLAEAVAAVILRPRCQEKMADLVVVVAIQALLAQAVLVLA